MNEYATTLILTVVRVSLVATHAHNEQTTGMHKGGRLVPVVMANSFLGETKSGQTASTPGQGFLTTRDQAGTNLSLQGMSRTEGRHKGKHRGDT